MNIKSERKINNTVISYKKLKSIANKVDQNSLLHEQNPNTATDKLISLIKECAKKATIIKINNKCKERTKRKNWITKAIMISCRTKEFLYKLWKKKPSCEALKLHNIKKYCNILDNIIKNAKFKYEKDVIKKCDDNPRQLWKIINSKLEKTSKPTTEIKNIYITTSKKLKTQKKQQIL